MTASACIGRHGTANTTANILFSRRRENPQVVLLDIMMPRTPLHHEIRTERGKTDRGGVAQSFAADERDIRTADHIRIGFEFRPASPATARPRSCASTYEPSIIVSRAGISQRR